MRARSFVWREQRRNRRVKEEQKREWSWPTFLLMVDRPWLLLVLLLLALDLFLLLVVVVRRGGGVGIGSALGRRLSRGLGGRGLCSWLALAGGVLDNDRAFFLLALALCRLGGGRGFCSWLGSGHLWDRQLQRLPGVAVLLAV